jgi:exopolysaccharide biosynthesis polyprenyl glycosylphosphotransferase
MSPARKSDLLTAVGRIFVDAAWICLAFLCALALTAPIESDLRAYAIEHLIYLIVFALLWCGVAVDQGVFVSRRSDTLVAVLFSTTKAFVTTFLITSFLMAVLAPDHVEREFLFAFGMCALVFSLFFTLVVRPSVWSLRRRGHGFRNILIIGANSRTTHLVEVLLANEHYGYHITGFLEDDPSRREVLERFGVHWLGGIQDIEKILVEHVVDGVYITLPVRSFYETVQNIAYLCEGVGVPVRLLADLFPLRMASSVVSRLDNLPILSLTSEVGVQTRFALKRAMDLAVSIALLVVLSPLLLGIAILLRLTSTGPVFVCKTRLGQGLRPFRMFSFRVTVSENGDSPTEPMTSLGQFLHRYGLDELPQTLNVVLGHMSLTGPRPLVPLKTECADELLQDDEDAVADNASTDRLEDESKRGLLYLILPAFMDALCIGAAYFASVVITAPSPNVVPYSLTNNIPYYVVFALVWFAAALDRGLWTNRPAENVTDYLVALTKAVGDALVLCVFIMVLLTPEGLSQDFLVAFCFATLLSLLTFRFVLRMAFAQIHRAGYGIRRVVMVGANQRTAHVVSALLSRQGRGYVIEGVVDDVADRASTAREFGVAYLGGVGALKGLLASGKVDEVYVSLPVRSQYERIQQVANRCEEAGVPVHLVADLFPVRIATSRIMLLEDIPLISMSPICEAHFRLAIKRAFDFLGSTALIIAFSPIFLLLAILIKLESPGAVFFLQERVGQNQRRFRMIKFRSMKANAEELKKELEAMNEADGPVFKMRKDPRVTKIGRFIRKYSVDELPQLFNVWVGQMSLVGPRPPIPVEVEKYTWPQRRRLSVKPGMTGLWQVSGRSDVSFTEWVEMDLSYIDTWSLWQDFTILLRTFRAVLTGRGAA